MTRERTAAATRAKWRRWHERIGNSVGLLLLDDDIFHKSMEIATNDQVVGPNNEVYQWALRVYATHAIMGLRRVLDRDERTYSLLHLVHEIEKHHYIITRQSYVRGWRSEKSLAHLEFDRLAGASVAHMPEATVRDDRRRLECLARQLKAITDKHFAHRDRKRGRIGRVTFSDLHALLKSVETMCIRYELMLRKTEPRTLLPSMNANAALRDAQTVWGRRPA